MQRAVGCPDPRVTSRPRARRDRSIRWGTAHRTHVGVEREDAAAQARPLCLASRRRVATCARIIATRTASIASTAPGRIEQHGNSVRHGGRAYCTLSAVPEGPLRALLSSSPSARRSGRDFTSELQPVEARHRRRWARLSARSAMMAPRVDPALPGEPP